MKISTIFRGILCAGLLCCAYVAQAGNIPQYSFAESRDGFRMVTDGTEIKTVYGVADEMVFKDKQTITAYTGQGFPIGFDFKFGGRIFNQFAVNNNGYLLFGYDRVEFNGYSNLFFTDASLYASNHFYVGLTPSMFSIKSGDISYKTEGAEGNRVTTVQFAHLNVNEPSVRGNAIYSLQIVLFEKDNRLAINFLEEESPYTSLGLKCGIYGWSNADSMLLYSRSLGQSASISTETVADMITPGALLHWDADDILGDEEEGHLDPYCFTFSFTPSGENNFSCSAPTDLNVEQYGDAVTVSCKRPADAPATAILFSESPITSFPEQGVSYPIFNDAKEYITTFGDATLIYYSNDAEPSAVVPNIKASTRYYVKAFGVNGYPSYSYDSSADLEFLSSHPAPYVMQATSADGAINLMTMGDDDVIIAYTLDRVKTSSEGASGIFGIPAENCAVGDKIDGGGEIIYIGKPGDFTFTDAVPNRQNFFRAWSLREGRVSKTYINASGVTNPTMPYEPMIELYTLYENPLNWITQTTSTDPKVSTNFVPRLRGANEDEAAVAGVSNSGTSATLISPVLKLGSDSKLSFEWSIETAREYPEQSDDLVQLPEGNEPGKFGAGHSFTVSCGPRGTENTLFTATEYNGKMAPSPNDQDHFISGTSEMIPVEVDIPEGISNARFTFQFSTEGFSMLFLRNIKITTTLGVQTPFGDDQNDVITAGEGTLTILSAKGGDYDVYSINGAKAASASLKAGEGCVIALGKGIYVVGNRKIIIR